MPKKTTQLKFDLSMEDFSYLPSMSFMQIIGTDEVGRGPLAGPVVSASTSLTLNNLKKVNIKKYAAFSNQLRKLGISDSKKVSFSKKQKILKSLNLLEQLDNKVEIKLLSENFCIRLNHFIFEDLTLDFCLSGLNSQSIDRLNILQASLETMNQSFIHIKNKDSYLWLIDGNQRPEKYNNSSKVINVIKGDTKDVLIGLSSIIAKYFRDELMKLLDRKYPEYFFNKNAGYPTKSHKQAIIKNGISPYHRKSFKGVREFLT